MAANLAQCWSSTDWLKLELTLQLGLAMGAGLRHAISCCRILSLSSPASDEGGSLYLGCVLFEIYFTRTQGADSVNSFRVYPRGMLGLGEAPCPLCLPLLKWLSVCLGYSSCAVHIIPCCPSGTVFGKHHVDSLLIFIFTINLSFVSCEPWTFLLSRSYQLWKIYK